MGLIYYYYYSCCYLNASEQYTKPTLLGIHTQLPAEKNIFIENLTFCTAGYTEVEIQTHSLDWCVEMEIFIENSNMLKEENPNLYLWFVFKAFFFFSP